MATAPTDIFEFCTRLAPGRERDYEFFHRAIPADLDRAMRAAGVLGWRIYRDGSTLTHVVEACDRARMRAALESDPVNRGWQEQVAPFLAAAQAAPASAALTASVAPRPAAPASASPAPVAPGPAQRGVLIWDLSWPTR